MIYGGNTCKLRVVLYDVLPQIDQRQHLVTLFAEFFIHVLENQQRKW